jgi:hypothetical protein
MSDSANSLALSVREQVALRAHTHARIRELTQLVHGLGYHPKPGPMAIPVTEGTLGELVNLLDQTRNRLAATAAADHPDSEDAILYRIAVRAMSATDSR